ncbi:EF-P 5-aminopentanol modification-associated protein YfmF [Shouchella lonarensis]|uniref:Predicted Zn-dependent peptidase n=1 Tax=Shouchella lonarensis TaxID=1464122 RepID=A0A1G6LK05_9BACI|nr:pitrilysin family protein [Shouchella lonarensis]SDC43543.1 Predicted Zn-dependent peptidase [Shouchella lonarensis]
MTNVNGSSQPCGGVQLHLWQTDKFKTISCILMIKSPLSVDTVTARALIPHILQRGTKQHPNRMALKRKLDDMYGAVLATDVQKKGEQHVITFRIDVASERFLSDQITLFQEALALLHEVLTEPNQEDGVFSQAIVEQEKRALKQRIQSVYDDKMRYANVRITEEMFSEELYRLPAYGREEDLATLTSENIYDVYKQMLAHDRMDLFIVGSFDETAAKTTVSKLFGAERSIQAQQAASAPSPSVVQEKVVRDEQKVKQGKLHMGYRTYTTFADDDYEAAQVANGIFGGFPSSKLFINVREKESLAYYAASRLESHKGVLMVMSGIEFDKYDRAVEIIKAQVTAMKQGDFTEKDIAQAKSMLLNQLWEAVDTARGFVELSYHEVVANARRSLLDRAEAIKQVTKEDIVQAANKWELDTIYFLTGAGEAK